MALAIPTILIALLMLVGLIVGITLWITGGRSRGSGEMACGGCGYAVRGLQALQCPECGADLRAVGINRPKGGTARNVGIALTLGTALLLLTCLGSMFLLIDAPSSIQSSPSPTAPTQAHPSSVHQPSSTPSVDAGDDPEVDTVETDR